MLMIVLSIATHNTTNSIRCVEALGSSSSAMSLSTSYCECRYLEHWIVQRPLVVGKVKHVVTGNLFALEEQFQQPNRGWGSMLTPSALDKH